MSQAGVQGRLALFQYHREKHGSFLPDHTRASVKTAGYGAHPLEVMWLKINNNERLRGL